MTTRTWAQAGSALMRRVASILLTGLAGGTRLPRWVLSLTAAACIFIAIRPGRSRLGDCRLPGRLDTVDEDDRIADSLRWRKLGRGQ